MRTPIVQKHPFGCAVACVAYALDFDYAKTLRLFKNGKRYAKSRGFYCKEIVEALRKIGKYCEYRYVSANIQKKIYKEGTIVFIKRSDKYPAGHYLYRTKNSWMDPWINFPKDQNIAHAEADFRKRLPSKPIYAIV